MNPNTMQKALAELGMLIAFIVILITIAIYWFVNCRILDRHLNLQ